MTSFSPSSSSISNQWGSFHNESVQHLIHQSIGEYKASPISDKIQKLEDKLFEDEAITELIDLIHNYDPLLNDEKYDNEYVKIDAKIIRIKKALFYLSDSYVFLNHGAFGCALKSMVKLRNEWTEYMEEQPVKFIDRELLPVLVYATRLVAKWLKIEPTKVVLTSNASTALTTVFRSIATRNKQARILRLSICYGAVKKMTDAFDFKVTELQITLPMLSFEESLFTPIKAILMKARAKKEQFVLATFDHIASNSAILLPIVQLTALLHSFGVLVCIDGAHGPLAGFSDGEELNLNDFAPDYYVGNFHKWMCSVKGNAFLYVHNASDTEYLSPPCVSHGYGSGFTSNFIWSGLNDYSTRITLIHLLKFWDKIGLAQMKLYCTKLAQWATRYMVSKWNTRSLIDHSLINQDPVIPMVCVLLPQLPDFYTLDPLTKITQPSILQNLLFDSYQIEVPVKVLDGKLYVRISAHCYNRKSDYIQLAKTIQELSQRYEIKQ